MTPSAQGQQALVALFNRQPCWMIQPLACQMDYSIPSVRRFLAQTGYYSSFTHNGRWYTLASIAQFDAQGLWFHQDIGFSRAGSLTNTLVALTTASARGLTAEQLGEKLRCRCHGVLVQLCRQGRMQRQKFGRSYRYLAADADTAQKQRRQLQPSVLPAEIAVMVLAQFIKSPGASWEQLAQSVFSGTGVRIDAEQIQALFDHHGLKKTTSTARLRR
jgi:hypothetical protein